MSSKKTGMPFVSTDPSPALKDHYITRILQLENELDNLNLLDNPAEIRTVCSKIMIIKNMLRAAYPQHGPQLPGSIFNG